MAPHELQELPTKMRAALKAGRVKRNRYVQPIDVIVSYAGSEATMASEPYDVIDGEAAACWPVRSSWLRPCSAPWLHR